MDMAERVASAMCLVWRGRAAALGGAVHAHDGIVSCLTGLDAPPFNPSLVERRPTDATAALAWAEGVYRAAGLSYGIDIDTDLHPEVRAAAEAAGLRIAETRPGMTATPAEVPEPIVPEGLTIERAHDRSDEVAAVATAGFGGDPAINRSFVAGPVFADPAARVYLAWRDDRPVATAETSLRDGVLGVFGVATVPDARREGIGRAITAHAVRDRAGEAYLAFLQSSEMGHRVYESLGFRDVSTWEVWARG